jgi:polyisoprenoid-binding protein YceI
MSLPQIPAGKWAVDATHSRIGFVARHLMVTKVRGTFRDYTADVVVADDPLESTVKVDVEMDSIDTGNADRDGHLRTNDFFDVPEHPTMSLVSTGFTSVDESEFKLHADLTVRGVTRPVTFDVEFEGVAKDPWGGTRAGFSAKTTINRKDWGIEWNAPLETGGVLVSDKVAIELDIQLVKE